MRTAIVARIQGPVSLSLCTASRSLLAFKSVSFFCAVVLCRARLARLLHSNCTHVKRLCPLRRCVASRTVFMTTLEECKSKAAAGIAKYTAEINGYTGGSGFSFEVDWDSFSGLANPERVYGQLTWWEGYYTFGYASYAIRECCQEYGGADKLRALSKIVFRHNKDGVDRENRIKIENNVVTIEASCCCTWHWMYTSDLTMQLVVFYELFDGYVTKIEEARVECQDKFKDVTLETDLDTFDFSSMPGLTDFQKKEMKGEALKNAASWSAWYSWRTVGWGSSYYKIGRAHV